MCKSSFSCREPSRVAWLCLEEMGVAKKDTELLGVANINKDIYETAKKVAANGAAVIAEGTIMTSRIALAKKRIDKKACKDGVNAAMDKVKGHAEELGVPVKECMLKFLVEEANSMILDI